MNQKGRLVKYITKLLDILTGLFGFRSAPTFFLSNGVAFTGEANTYSRRNKISQLALNSWDVYLLALESAPRKQMLIIL